MTAIYHTGRYNIIHLLYRDTHDAIIINCTTHEESITHFRDVYHRDKAQVHRLTWLVSCHHKKKDTTRNRKKIYF